MPSKYRLDTREEESMLVSHGKSHGMMVNVSQQPSEGFLLFFALQNIGLQSYTSKWGHFQSNQEIQHKRACKHQRHCGVSDHGCKQQFDLILHVYGIGELYDKASECDPAMQLCEYS
jgi:hypothetical protein